MPRSSVVRSTVNSSPREIEAPRRETVHIWRGLLDVDESELRVAGFLVAEELERAARFRFELHRFRFIAGRAFLKSILGGYLKCRPGEIEFNYSAFGKPHLKQDGLCFNVAHSEDRFLLAVCEKPVGIDIEVRRLIPDLDSLAAQVFSELELQQWGANRTSDKFLSLWTRKEALLKGIGLGIANHVKEVSVFFGNDACIEVPNSFSSDDWTVRTLLDEKEIWSLAVPFGNPQLSLHTRSASFCSIASKY